MIVGGLTGGGVTNSIRKRYSQAVFSFMTRKINGKTKDGVNARLDLIKNNIQGELAQIQVCKRTYLPLSYYTM